MRNRTNRTSLNLPRSRLTIVCFGLGLTGTTAAFAFRLYTSSGSWPMDIGGKSATAFPALVPVAFEVTVLLTAIGTVLALLARCRLWPGKAAELQMRVARLLADAGAAPRSRWLRSPSSAWPAATHPPRALPAPPDGPAATPNPSSGRATRLATPLLLLLAPLAAGQEREPGFQEQAALFSAECGKCHTIGKGDRVGPDLAGVTGRRDREWLVGFIQDPDPYLDGDPLGIELLQAYQGVRMEDRGLSRAQVEGLLAYIDTFSKAPAAVREPPADAPTKSDRYAQVDLPDEGRSLEYASPEPQKPVAHRSLANRCRRAIAVRCAGLGVAE